MFGFPHILAYDLSTMAFIAGTTALMAISALAAVLVNRKPASIRALDLAPAFGL